MSLNSQQPEWYISPYAAYSEQYTTVSVDETKSKINF